MIISKTLKRFVVGKMYDTLPFLKLCSTPICNSHLLFPKMTFTKIPIRLCPNNI